jgi:hypothetical protein
MLFIHDVHEVIGEREYDFEDAVRDVYAPAVSEDGARLLWYLHSVHGAAPAYTIVTVTAVRDGATWHRLVQRMTGGDLADWRENVDAMRYGCTSSLLVQTDWSPLGPVDLNSINARELDERATIVFREDTLTGDGATGLVSSIEPSDPKDLLQCVAAFRPALAPDGRLVVLYRAPSEERWIDAFGSDPGERDWSGSVLPERPNGIAASSLVLRTSHWSPLT